MNILIFGPNGSGKGTQGAIVQQKYGVPHIETGVIFREAIKAGTALGRQAQGFIDRGELVPDAVTVPLILERLHQPDCRQGWLLDGFPRNLAQAEALWKALLEARMTLDAVIEIVLDRQTAKQRIMGRRLCACDNNHPNNIHIDAIKPAMKDGRPVCRVCGCETLTTRADDQDEKAIDRRHGIYYDGQAGTLAAVGYFRQRVPVIQIDGTPGVKAVSEALLAKLP